MNSSSWWKWGRSIFWMLTFIKLMRSFGLDSARFLRSFWLISKTQMLLSFRQKTQAFILQRRDMWCLCSFCIRLHIRLDRTCSYIDSLSFKLWCSDLLTGCQKTDFLQSFQSEKEMCLESTTFTTFWLISKNWTYLNTESTTWRTFRRTTLNKK